MTLGLFCFRYQLFIGLLLFPVGENHFKKDKNRI